MIKKESTHTFCADTQLGQVDNSIEWREIQDSFVPRADEVNNLARTYFRLGYNDKADRVIHCGDFLSFRRGIYDDGSLAETSQLHTANFCHDRLCPMCQWRRSLKMFSQMIQVSEVICNDYDFLFLTLTVPNCAGVILRQEIQKMQNAWDKFSHDTKFKRICKGYVKSIEVTYNKKSDTYHPHVHVLLAVEHDYFKSDNYITHSEWLLKWQKATQNDSIQFVNIKAVYDKNSKQTLSEQPQKTLCDYSYIAEICKYPIKPFDLTSDSVVQTLSDALCGLRLVSFGGIFKTVRKSLQLDDVENGNLINVDDEVLEQFNAYLISWYHRDFGLSDYRLQKQYVKVVP